MVSGVRFQVKARVSDPDTRNLEPETKRQDKKKRRNNVEKINIIFTAIILHRNSLNARVWAQETSPKDPYSGDLWSRSTLTGDWGGFRNEWAAKGVTIDTNITQIGQGDVE